MDIEKWMEDYTTYLLKLSYLYVRDRQIAEDIVQEVFVKLYHQNPNNIEPGKEKSYIVKMTIRKTHLIMKNLKTVNPKGRNQIRKQKIRTARKRISVAVCTCMKMAL